MTTAAGGAEGSGGGTPFLGEAPVRSQPAAQQPAPTAAAEGQQHSEATDLPPYEHPALEKLAKGKYRTVDDVAKAYESSHSEMKRLQTAKEALETRLGMWKGPPTDEEGKARPYQFKQSEESLAKFGPVDPDTPEFQFVTAWGHKWGCSEEAINELFPLYEQLIGGSIEGNSDAVKAELINHFGTPEEMHRVLNDTWGWLEDKVGEDQRVSIRRLLMNSPEAAPILDRLIKALDQTPLPNSGGATAGAGDTEANIVRLRSEPGWQNDPAKVAREKAWVEAEAAKMEAVEFQNGGKPFTELRMEAMAAQRRG